MSLGTKNVTCNTSAKLRFVVCRVSGRSGKATQETDTATRICTFFLFLAMEDPFRVIAREYNAHYATRRAHIDDINLHVALMF